MEQLRIGDRVRYLSQTGGGVVKRIIDKNTVEVSDDMGFDIPVRMSECVVVDRAQVSEPKKQTSKRDVCSEKPSDTFRNRTCSDFMPKRNNVIEEEDDEIPVFSSIEETPYETKEGESLTVAFGFIPEDNRKIQETDTIVYLINDSNYYVSYNVIQTGGDLVFSRYCGVIAPNTKEEIDRVPKQRISELENLGVQLMAYKEGKSYKRQNVFDINFKYSAVKFYKLHCYVENDYFEENAIIVPLVKDGSDCWSERLGREDITKMLESKETPEPVKKSKSSKQTNEIIEVDLHIRALIDNTSQLTNKDMLDYQMSKFREVMETYKTEKGREIVFIHGKGEGVLRKSILDELKKKYPKCESRDASFLEYGFGATLVKIR